MPKRRKPAIPKPDERIVPRQGPPVNLRPGGAHKDRRRTTRAEMKAALRRAAFERPRGRAAAIVVIKAGFLGIFTPIHTPSTGIPQKRCRPRVDFVCPSVIIYRSWL